MNADRLPRLRMAPWLALALVWLLAGCGGGVGTGGTGAFSSGPITGYGSIIVNGVHFDETLARVEDDDGAGRDRGDLRLGTVVEVDSDEVRDAAAQASRVRIVSVLIGSTEAVSADTLLVNGQTVHINAGTVFDDRLAAGVAAIALGRVVEVYGFVMSSAGDILATRIEPRDGATAFKFRGVVTVLNTQLRMFNIGTQRFIYPAQMAGRDELRDGASLRVLVEPQRDAQGRWTVTAIGGTVFASGDRPQADARGVITAFASNASFQVAGFTVDAAAAQIEGGPLAAGLRVEIEGRLQAGVLVARKVKVEDENGNDELELRGTIASVDAVGKVFELNGRRERVSFARVDIVYENGDASLLTVGRKVRAFGRLSADRTQVEATRIRFDN